MFSQENKYDIIFRNDFCRGDGMAELLIKIFTRNSNSDEETRLKTGEACGIAGIILNLVLVIGKLVIGIVSASLSIIADAMNNLSDACSSITTLVGFRLSGQKPDREHPYGHGRMEYVSAMVVSFIILVVGFELGKESLDKVINPAETSYSVTGLAVLAAAVLIKAYMALFNFREAKNIKSETLKAVGRDSLIDCIATSFIIVTALIQMNTGVALDGYAGLVISAFIMFQGFCSLKDAVNPLLGMEPDPEFVQAIRDITLNFDENIVGIHDLMVHDYGPGRRIISLHAEVPSDGNILALHDIIDNLEKKLSNDLKCLATIHMDPVAAHDPVTLELREKVRQTLKAYNDSLTFHDFRVVHGDTHTNLLFDLAVPYELDMQPGEIRNAVIDEIHNKMGEEYDAVFEIDRV